jgi:phosphoglycolate phosphatase
MPVNSNEIINLASSHEGNRSEKLKQTLIFDLDGTLIDSSEGILCAFRGAFAAAGSEPVRPITSDIIGPSLIETLALLAGTDDVDVLDSLVQEFKAAYDNEGYKSTTGFPGVEKILRELADEGRELFIATNKRLLPTQRILIHFGWEYLFRGVYALDSFDPPLRSKAEMIRRILEIHGLERQHTTYIGDRQQDGDAAVANGLCFGFAAWGYGSDGIDDVTGGILLDHPEAFCTISDGDHKEGNVG